MKTVTVNKITFVDSNNHGNLEKVEVPINKKKLEMRGWADEGCFVTIRYDNGKSQTKYGFRDFAGCYKDLEKYLDFKLKEDEIVLFCDFQEKARYFNMVENKLLNDFVEGARANYVLLRDGGVIKNVITSIIKNGIINMSYIKLNNFVDEPVEEYDEVAYPLDLVQEIRVINVNKEIEMDYIVEFEKDVDSFSGYRMVEDSLKIGVTESGLNAWLRGEPITKVHNKLFLHYF